MNKREALQTLQEHYGMEEAGEFMGDFCLEPRKSEITWNREVIEAMRVLGGEECEITAVHEELTKIDRPFADDFADLWDLCAEHSCDIEICRDDERPCQKS